MNITKAIASLAVIAALTLTGCSIKAAPNSDAPKKPTATAQPIKEEVPEVEVDTMVVGFGEVLTYQDNVSISVSEGVPFTPTEWSAGSVEGQQHLAFTVVLTNDSKSVVEPFSSSSVSSGGQKASAIYDADSPIGDVGFSGDTAILPGQSLTWIEGYSVVDPSSLTFQISPSFEYKDAIFTNIEQ